MILFCIIKNIICVKEFMDNAIELAIKQNNSHAQVGMNRLIAFLALIDTIADTRTWSFMISKQEVILNKKNSNYFKSDDFSWRLIIVHEKLSLIIYLLRNHLNDLEILEKVDKVKDLLKDELETLDEVFKERDFYDALCELCRFFTDKSNLSENLFLEYTNFIFYFKKLELNGCFEKVDKYIDDFENC